MTQRKIADVSLTRHKLIPVRIRGVPIRVWGVRQKNSHMGRHITHNEVEHIWGLTCIQGHANPRVHTGISWTLIPVCIRGFAQSPYAYGDISVTNRMHMGNMSIWEIRSCIPICVISQTGIAVCIWGSPYANGRGWLKSSHMGIPVCIMKLCACGD